MPMDQHWFVDFLYAFSIFSRPYLSMPNGPAYGTSCRLSVVVVGLSVCLQRL